MNSLFDDFKEFLTGWYIYLSVPTKRGFFRFEDGKNFLAENLYKQRGKLSRPFIHSGMMGIAAMGVILAPIVSDQVGNTNPWQIATPGVVLSATTQDEQTATIISDKARDLKTLYTIKEGDTISSIAQKYGVSEDTVMWANDLNKKSILKTGQVLTILPDNGVLHKVSKGENIYSIAKKYDAEPQALVDFPFNTFVNDETFALAVGQELFVPNGVPPKEAPTGVSGFARRQTPDAGTITASGSFVWPTSGTITQPFVWYHRGLDIANRSAPDILAADSGTVIVAGWPDNGGYGMRVIIDHGNGYRTLYAHLQATYVSVGQTVARGNAIGKMGSTGRSTGTHLHFEIHQGGSFLNPLEFLR